MIKIIIGKKGSGKTKKLVDLVNAATAESLGNVVCIEKGTKLRFDIKYQARLINTEEYFIEDASALYGFVAGILASNHDVTDLFVDSALKICKNDVAEFEKMVVALDKLLEGSTVKVTITSSIPVEEASDVVKKYL